MAESNSLGTYEQLVARFKELNKGDEPQFITKNTSPHAKAPYWKAVLQNVSLPYDGEGYTEKEAKKKALKNYIQGVH